MNKYKLFSRDSRTFSLFRKNWVSAIEENGHDLGIWNRGFGARNVWNAFREFYRSKGTRRLIFGTSEVFLYLCLSHERDVFIFTGLGRLLQEKTFRSRIAGLVLRLFYRGQCLVVLNSDDAAYIQEVVGYRPHVLDGEGYDFGAQLLPQPLSGRVVFAYVGRLLKSKGVDLLIDQFLAARARGGCEAELLLVGDFDYSNSDSIPKAWFSKKLMQSGRSISHIGYVNDVKRILSQVHVTISMSRREGLPFGVLDGIDSGCLVILSPVPGHLAFQALPGVLLVGAHGLANAISDILLRPENYLCFDRLGRIETCRNLFGGSTIKQSIATILFGERSSAVSADRT